MKSQKALERALKALESDKKKIDIESEKLGGQITELRSMLGRGGVGGKKRSRKKTAKKRRRLSAAGRKAISDAMKKRWAERKKAKG